MRLSCLKPNNHRWRNCLSANTILITGATGAIGRALAQHYAAPGITLILQGRDDIKLREIADQCTDSGATVIVYQADLRNIPALLAWLDFLIAKHLPDLVIANAGINTNVQKGGGCENGDAAQALIDLNIKSTIALVNHLIPALRQRGSGQIALISSLAAYYGLPITPSYSASKAAIKAYGEALRGGLSKYGIRVNVVMPGYIKSDMCDAMPGPKPFLWTPERAARAIANGLSKNKARISFPFPLDLGTWLLSVMSPEVSQAILKILGYVPK